MAGIFTHLVIAKEILKQLPQGTIIDEGLFYAGSIAPDAIHAREGFVRAEKKHTHLRDDIPDKDFGQENNLALFHQRVADFILECREKKDGFLDLYRGYVVHILTDELFVLTVRQEFCDTMEQLGIAQSDIEFFDIILTDMNISDIILSRNYEGSAEIRLHMERVNPHQIEGLLSEVEINNSKEWAINRYFYEEHELLEPAYITYERILEFIELATKDIIGRLSEGGNLPRMF